MSQTVEWDSEIFAKINQVKNHTIRYVLVSYSVSNHRFSVDLQASFYGNYNNFLSALPWNKSRYALIDFEFQAEAGKQSEIVFFAWNPDKANHHDKLVFNTHYDSFVRKGGLESVITVQPKDMDEIKYEEILKKVKGG